jgi:hypothetical protein
MQSIKKNYISKASRLNGILNMNTPNTLQPQCSSTPSHHTQGCFVCGVMVDCRERYKLVRQKEATVAGDLVEHYLNVKVIELEGRYICRNCFRKIRLSEKKRKSHTKEKTATKRKYAPAKTLFKKTKVSKLFMLKVN